MLALIHQPLLIVSSKLNLMYYFYRRFVNPSILSKKSHIFEAFSSFITN